jgi:hypothetical protein
VWSEAPSSPLRRDRPRRPGARLAMTRPSARHVRQLQIVLLYRAAFTVHGGGAGHSPPKGRPASAANSSACKRALESPIRVKPLRRDQYRSPALLGHRAVIGTPVVVRAALGSRRAGKFDRARRAQRHSCSRVRNQESASEPRPVAISRRSSGSACVRPRPGAPTRLPGADCLKIARQVDDRLTALRGRRAHLGRPLEAAQRRTS